MEDLKIIAAAILFYLIARVSIPVPAVIAIMWLIVVYFANRREIKKD